MSYCVNCGVELDSTASFCPLCRTPVRNPGQPVDRDSPAPFPTELGKVSLASQRAAAVLISAMLGSVAQSLACACSATRPGTGTLCTGCLRSWSCRFCSRYSF